MFELVGSQFEKGLLELDFEERQRGIKKLLIKLGPVTSRLVALVFFVSAAFLTFYRQPGLFLLSRGWVDSTERALSFQQYFNWGLMGIGLILYLGIFLFHRKYLGLVFDRSKSTIRYRESSSSRYRSVEEGLISFANILEFKVIGPKGEPATPYGCIYLRGKKLGSEGIEKAFYLGLLSEEQLQFYPANLAKIFDREPTGDWKE